MKKIKKVIILSIVIIIVIYLIYNYSNNNANEFIEEEVYVETGNFLEESNKMILHITGEVRMPRNYRIRRRSKVGRCNK